MIDDPSSTTAVPCPACGAASAGRFCAECGAAIEGACAACRSLLAPGARFCHRCGAAVGALGTPVVPARIAAAARTNALPWAIGGIAFLLVVVIFAAQRSQVSTPEPAGMPSAGAPLAAGAPPDISSMSPRERADRLFNRVMRLDTEGKRDSVEMFATMAIAAYDALGSLDADARYDMGRVAEVSGRLDLAAAQADTILRSDTDHLLGLILSSRIAGLRGDTQRRNQLEQRLLAAQPAEMAKNRGEYERHRNDIDAAVTAARSRPR